MKVSTLDADLEAKFSTELDILRQEHKIPGMSAAVVRDQKVVYARGFGYADLQNQVLATEHTPYNLASCTKPIAAVVLMRLVETGQLDLDIPMADILRDTVFPVRYRNENGTWVQIHGYKAFCRIAQQHPELEYSYTNYHWDTERITVRHHLTHTSQEVPGEAYLYNGDLYALLSTVAEEASGMAFADLLVEEIIRPLGMTRTVPGINAARRDQVLIERTKYYREDDKGNPVEVQVERPIRWPASFAETGLDLDPSLLISAGAGIVSTVLDLAKLDVALDQNQLVSEATKKAMFTPIRSNNGQLLPYGLGWFVQGVTGTKVIWHYGDGGDYSSLYVKVPSEQTSLILLANSGGLSRRFGLGADPAPESVLKSPFATTFLDSFTELGFRQG
jgi:CubicO group peptidase (beta-lactamase class C family)